MFQQFVTFKEWLLKGKHWTEEKKDFFPAEKSIQLFPFQ
jgi:hypothetical protein